MNEDESVTPFVNRPSTFRCWGFPRRFIDLHTETLATALLARRPRWEGVNLMRCNQRLNS